jgi:hypothetical protein
MARPAVATATAASSMDVVKEYSTGPLAVRAVRKLNVLALSLLIVPLRLWDTPHVLLSRRQVTAVQREDVPTYADPGQVADLLAAARVDPDVGGTVPAPGSHHHRRRPAGPKGATSGQPDRCPVSGRTHSAGRDH